jgi:DNA-binding CsgD family transcriptional regulator
VRAAAFLYFCAVAALGFLLVRAAYGLQVRHRQPYLPAWTLYVGFWSGLSLLLILQYVLVLVVLPREWHGPFMLAISPLLILLTAFALYFLSSFLAQISGGSLPRWYRAVFAGAWGLVGVILLAAIASGADSQLRFPPLASMISGIIKIATVVGWIAYALVRSGRLDDPLERAGVRRVVWWLLGGFLAFELAFRDVLRPVGLRTSDYVLGLLQAGLNIPALVALTAFVRRQARERPAVEPQLDVADLLTPLGLSAREVEVVELLMRGLSNKEIAERLFISVDTVKKHTYNVYRKLGVQNRVQLSYFVRNQPTSIPSATPPQD